MQRCLRFRVVMLLGCVCNICHTNRSHILPCLNVLVIDMVLIMAVPLDDSELLGFSLYSCGSLYPMVPLAQQKKQHLLNHQHLYPAALLCFLEVFRANID